MANNILEQINTSYGKRVKEAQLTQSTKKQQKRFGDYEKALADKQTLEVIFDSADEAGNLSTVDAQGIAIVLLADDFAKANDYYTKKIKSKFVGLTLNVKVSKINEKDGVVFVKSANNANDIKGSLMKAIFTELNAGKTPRLWGDIIFVNNKRVTVNILHKNILGMIDISDWSPTYTQFLRLHAKVGESIEFDVTGTMPRQKGRDYAFKCVRKTCVPNPWEVAVPVNKGDVITLRCVDKPEGKKYFWANYNRIKDIDVMCTFPYDITIMVGATYKARVKEFDKEKKVFVCEIIELIPSGIATAENIRFVKSKGAGKGSINE